MWLVLAISFLSSWALVGIWFGVWLGLAAIATPLPRETRITNYEGTGGVTVVGSHDLVWIWLVWLLRSPLSCGSSVVVGDW